MYLSKANLESVAQKAVEGYLGDGLLNLSHAIAGELEENGIKEVNIGYVYEPLQYYVHVNQFTITLTLEGEEPQFVVSEVIRG